MRFYLMLFLFQFFITSCQSSEPKAKTEAAKATPAPAVVAAPVPNYEMKPDTIVVHGKFLQGCHMPDIIRIALHNVDNTWWKDVKVSPNGEFSYTHFLTEPRRIALRTKFGVKFDFFATTRERVYNVEISCNGGKESFAIKGSAENEAYQPFIAVNKQYQADLDSLAKQDLSKPETLELLKKTIGDYQKTLADIAKENPTTFTAQMFIPMETLPEGSLSSVEALRANFLKRDAYANPQVYNDFLPQRILMNYVAIRKPNEGADQAVETLMNIALRNRTAAMKMQGNMNSIFYNMHQEDLYIAFIRWAERNPDKIYNSEVKSRLANLKGVMAGNNMIDFQLTDAKGTSRKLSETVNNSKLTVLIFYSPGCGHCQKSVPQLIPYWDKYGKEGLGIVAVGSDAKEEEWRKFIVEKAKPEWVHFLEVETSAHPSNQYYAENPSFILIDDQGKIVSRIGDLEYVKEEIEKRFN